MRFRYAAAFLAVALLAATAGALPSRYYYEWATGSNAQACSAGTCARSAAPSGGSIGMSLAGVVGYRLTICAAAGQTLSGAGTMQAWMYHQDEATWTRNPNLDQSVIVTSTSCNGSPCQCETFPDFTIGSRLGHRVLFSASGVTVSGGSTLDVLLDGQVTSD